jgi:hypothetical protein
MSIALPIEDFVGVIIALLKYVFCVELALDFFTEGNVRCFEMSVRIRVVCCRTYADRVNLPKAQMSAAKART